MVEGSLSWLELSCVKEKDTESEKKRVVRGGERTFRESLV